MNSDKAVRIVEVYVCCCFFGGVLGLLDLELGRLLLCGGRLVLEPWAHGCLILVKKTWSAQRLLGNGSAGAPLGPRLDRLAMNEQRDKGDVSSRSS
jgi:hypothetical protein